MNNKGSSILLIVCIIVMSGVCGGLFFLRSSKEKPEVKTPEREEKTRTTKEIAKSVEADVDTKTLPATPKTSFDTTDDLIDNFKGELLKIESSEDLSTLMKDIGVVDIDDAQIEELYKRIGKNGDLLEKNNPIVEIGEIKRKEHSRYALKLKDGSRVFFDVKKNTDGDWVITKILPTDGEETNLDAILVKGNEAQKNGLLVTHSFVQFAIQQEFSKAKQLADSTTLSDVQLAGLCIIFDEGDYKLRNPRGVLTNYSKDTLAGYSVVIEDSSKRDAQFSIVLSRDKVESPWKVSQLNFSGLLAKFIESNGGDNYFTPMVKNPQGGDSIVVYFAFNEQGLSPRTQRQLKIVANILKLDSNKKITLTGHTDAVGGDQYNKNLSQSRAVAVRDFLTEEGVSAEQITTIGFGAHRPRKSNTLSDGSDNPDGRKANRRTEIYLDF